MHRDDDLARIARQNGAGRSALVKLPGLGWPHAHVLKAVGDLAMELWECRLTLADVVERLSLMTSYSHQQVDATLDALAERGYLYADAAPGNPETMLHLMPKGLDEYCYRYVPGYSSARLDVLGLISRDIGCDIHELARRTGHPALLIEHILDGAHAEGLLRVVKHGQFIRVTEVRPQLRRLVAGATPRLRATGS
jgi:hypothetical protein